MCRAAARDGITVLAATPHVRRDYPTTPAQMEQRLEEVRAAAGDVLRLVPGGEIDLAELARPRAELARFALAGNPRYLLVETPYAGWPLDLPDRLFQLRTRGVTPVLAHPERNADVQRRPELLEAIVSGGTLVQVTAAAVDGRLGRAAKGCATTLIERGLAHMITSDGHAPSVRAIGMSSAVAAVGDERLARWLTDDVPRAIVDDERIPPRPVAVRPRRRWFGR